MAILEKHIHRDENDKKNKSIAIQVIISLTLSTSALEKLKGVKFINFSED